MPEDHATVRMHWSSPVILTAVSSSRPEFPEWCLGPCCRSHHNDVLAIMHEFSGHSLRAGFVTSAAEAGANIFKTAEVSRHRSLDNAGLRPARRHVQGARRGGVPVNPDQIKQLAAVLSNFEVGVVLAGLIGPAVWSITAAHELLGRLP